MSKQERPGARRRSKFNAVKTVVDEITFDSQREARRYQQLKLEERGGSVASLTLQVPYRCNVLGHDGALHTICTYIADFVYRRIYADGSTAWIVEDAKGVPTPEFKLKAKLVRALFGVAIECV